MSDGATGATGVAAATYGVKCPHCGEFVPTPGLVPDRTARAVADALARPTAPPIPTKVADPAEAFMNGALCGLVIAALLLIGLGLAQLLR